MRISFHASVDADGDTPEPPRRGRIGEQVVRKHRVMIEGRIAVKADLLRRAHQKLDCILVIQIICASSCSLPAASNWDYLLPGLGGL